MVLEDLYVLMDFFFLPNFAKGRFERAIDGMSCNFVDNIENKE